MHSSTATTCLPNLAPARKEAALPSRRHKLAAAAAVLALGFGLASFVGRKRPTTPAPRFNAVQPSDPAKFSASDSGTSRPDGLEIAFPEDDAHASFYRPLDPSIESGGTPATSVAVSESAPIASPAPTRPPIIQRTNPPTLPTELGAEGSPSTSLEITTTPTAPSRAPEATDHVIHNGDTLERLARRYLGDESRALEIFQLNRDVLNNPHILPIGVELRIPPRSGVGLRGP